VYAPALWSLQTCDTEQKKGQTPTNSHGFRICEWKTGSGPKTPKGTKRLPKHWPDPLLHKKCGNDSLRKFFVLGCETVLAEIDLLVPGEGNLPDRVENFRSEFKIPADQTSQWLIDYELSSPERARQRIRFFDTYRSYVINYNLGKDLVRDYVERGTSTQDERWHRFQQLLSSPLLTDDLL